MHLVGENRLVLASNLDENDLPQNLLFMATFLYFKTILNSTASMTLTWWRHPRHLMLDMMWAFPLWKFSGQP
jgi:hypothetical protein